MMAHAKVDTKSITITHFINPHLFWYRQIDAYNEDYSEIVELEEQLGKYYKCQQRVQKEALRRPAVNSIVAVKFLSWNKFIRARVEHIASFTRNEYGGEYIMWALDYGFPFQAKADHIFHLPEQFVLPKEPIRRGGLADAFPAERDFIKDCSVTRTKECWHQRACDLMEKIVNEADSVVFTEEFRTQNQTWGNLMVTTHLGVTYDMRDYLISSNLAVDAQSNFQKQCLRLKTTKILPWMTNNGSSKFSTNKGVSYAINKGGNGNALLSLECNDFAKRKVEDWHMRNRSAAERCNELLDITDDDLWNNTSLNEFAARKFPCLEKCIVAPTALLNDQQMGLAGALTITRLQKYTDGKRLPPPPMDTSFEMSFDEKDYMPDTDILLEKLQLIERREKVVSNSIDASQSESIFKYEILLESDTSTYSEQQQKFENEMPEMRNTRIVSSNNETNPPAAAVKSTFRENLIKIRKMYIERTNKQKQRNDINAVDEKINHPYDDELLQVPEKRIQTIKPKLNPAEINARTPFHGIQMIPAGFDFINLYHYNDENHWHRKATTLRDHVPHDDRDFLY